MSFNEMFTMGLMYIIFNFFLHTMLRSFISEETNVSVES